MALGTLGAIALGSAVLGTGAKALGASAAGRAAGRAADAQTQQAQLAMEEQRRQFDAMQQLLKPYVDAGNPALQSIMGAAGLLGPGSQQAFADQQANSPMFQALARQGEDAILQNASATGGLRGGNVQGALGQFRPALLNQFIEQQYGRLAGIAGNGQNAAANLGAAGMRNASAIGEQYGNIGAAQAGGILGKGQAQAGIFGAIGNGLGQIGGMAASGMFGGGGQTIQPYAAPGLNVPSMRIPQFPRPYTGL
jgi:hypothetical protein